MFWLLERLMLRLLSLTELLWFLRILSFCSSTVILDFTSAGNTALFGLSWDTHNTITCCIYKRLPIMLSSLNLNPSFQSVTQLYWLKLMVVLFYSSSYFLIKRETTIGNIKNFTSTDLTYSGNVTVGHLPISSLDTIWLVLVLWRRLGPGWNNSNCKERVNYRLRFLDQCHCKAIK